MKKTQLYPLFFPLLIVVFGIITYKVLQYEPNIYTIMTNIILAYVLSPKVKRIETQSGMKNQITWLFYKKVIS